MFLRHKIFLPYIFNLSNENITIKITIPENKKLENEVDYFEIRIETNNEEFVNFIFYFKLFFFIVSLCMFIKFHKKLSLQLKTSILLEQRIIYIISVFLILYNIPFSFYFTEIKPHLYLIELFCLVNIIFFSLILYFWLVSFEIAFSKKNEFKVYQSWWKVTLTIVMILYGFILYVDESLSFLNDPTSIQKHHLYKHWVIYCRYIYNVSCIIVLVFIVHYLYQIQVKINDSAKLQRNENEIQDFDYFLNLFHFLTFFV